MLAIKLYNSPTVGAIRTIVVDDHEMWLSKVRLLLGTRPECQVIGEASDGLTAVQSAKELKPDLILLDIGIPNLNGIEAARQIRQVSPNSKIVFVSMENSPDVVQVALSTGALGFVHKARAYRDLLPAVEAVLQGQEFVTSTLQIEASVATPTEVFAIFQGLPDRDATWLETVLGIGEAQKRMQEIATKSPAPYFVFDTRRHAVVARLDTSRGESNRRLPATGTDS